VKVPKTADTPFNRYGHSVVAYGDLIYLWGGRNDSVCENTTYCYNTITDEWTRPEVSGDVPMGTDGHAACIHEGIMYVYGGYIGQSNELTSSLYSLNLETMRWTLLPECGDHPKYRDFHTMNATPDGNLIIFGGREYQESAQSDQRPESYPSDIHIYDLELKTWKKIEASGKVMPLGRRSHSSFIYGERMFIFGGFARGDPFHDSRKMHFNDLFAFHLGTHTWFKIESKGVKPSPRRRQAIIVKNDIVYMFGGTHPVRTINPALLSGYPVGHDFVVSVSSEELVELDELWLLDLGNTKSYPYGAIETI